MSSILIAPVRFYQYAISPFTPAACRHVPSCSEYSVQALKMHGPGRGGLMAVQRIARCHPWGTSGFDPVPKIIIKKVNMNKYMSVKKSAPYYDLLKGKLVMALLILLAFMVSCGPGQPQAEESGNSKVLVSILPYKYFVENIADGLIDVMVLIPPGSSPHVYDPTPRQMAVINHVDIYFYNGNLTFERSLIDKMKDNFPNLELYCVDDGIEVIENEDCSNDDDHSGHDHKHLGIDPHTWLSTVNGKIIANNVFTILSHKYPQHKAEFLDNYEQLIAEIDRVHFEITEQLANIPTRKFMIFHPSLSYFARDYHLQQIPVEFEGKEPSPAQLKASIDLAKREGLKTILIQKEFDMDNAKIIAAEIGGEVVQIDPLSGNWNKSLMDIAKKIRLSTQEL